MATLQQALIQHTRRRLWIEHRRGTTLACAPRWRGSGQWLLIARTDRTVIH